MTYSIGDAKFYGPLIATTTFAFVATLSTVVRFLARIFKKTGIGLDDYLILLALGFLYIILALQYSVIIVGGGGRHVTNVKAEDFTKTLKMLLPIEISYSICLAAVKLGILSFYLRIFGSRAIFRRLAYIVMVVVFLWVLSIILETMLLCRPFAYNWDLTIDGVCGDRPTVYFSAGVLNIITDFMVLLLPLREIWRLQLSKQRKYGLMVMFSFGILVSAVSIVRLKSVQEIKFDDATYFLPMPIMWSLLEAELAIMIANLPMFRPFIATVCAGFSTHSEPSTIDLEAMKPRRYARVNGEHEDRAFPTINVITAEPRRPPSAFMMHPNNPIENNDFNHSKDMRPTINVVREWRIEG